MNFKFFLGIISVRDAHICRTRMATVLTNAGGITRKFPRLVEIIKMPGIKQQRWRLQSTESVPNGPNGQKGSTMLENQSLLKSVTSALESSADGMVLIGPLVKRFTELELTIKHRDDEKQWMQKEFGLQYKVWNAKYRETLQQLSETRLRMLEASHQLHCRGIIESFGKKFGPKVLKQALKSFNGPDLPRMSRRDVWRILKRYLTSLNGKDVTNLEQNGEKLVPSDEFEMLEKLVADIYEKTSHDVHEQRNSEGVVLIDAGKLLPSETNIMKALCELYLIPWRCYRGEFLVNHNTPGASRSWDAKDDELSD